jgi:hypothetical protein
MLCEDCLIDYGNNQICINCGSTREDRKSREEHEKMNNPYFKAYLRGAREATEDILVQKEIDEMTKTKEEKDG